MSTTHRIPDPGFALLGELSRRTDGQRHAPAEVLDAVTILTAAADPDRADRLRPRPTEPSTIVLRLAVWALRNLNWIDADQVVATAQAALRPTPVPAPAGSLAIAC